MNDSYEELVAAELRAWQRKMLRRPSLFSKVSSKIQAKMNSWIPEKVHQAITVAMKQMIRAVVSGAKYATSKPLRNASLQQREISVRKKIELYKKTAAVEGGITGAWGLIAGMADFPVLIAIKIKMLSDIAALYGFDIEEFKERVYLLYIFELAFSSDSHRKEVYLKMTGWENKSSSLPADIHRFDWRKFQQEYRDYLDIAKMAQMIPVVGAPVGLVTNYRLLKKLGITAMNAYRMRLADNPKPLDR